MEGHSTATRREGFYVGWDVGGWSCDRNRSSQDAVVVLDGERTVVGEPWRGNLRDVINRSTRSQDFIEELSNLCRAEPLREATGVTLAIDAPLSFSAEFLALTGHLKAVASIGHWHTNPYLFRRTERLLFERGLRPLSAIQDMIGSQATKARHVLAKFAPETVACGVWTDGDRLTVIEAYPSSCQKSEVIKSLRSGYGDLGHQDNDDALTCALIGYMYACCPEQLEFPDATVPQSEGWIWVPRDAFSATRSGSSP
jgi:predicted nuclease with RNAse H fold